MKEAMFMNSSLFLWELLHCPHWTHTRAFLRAVALPCGPVNSSLLYSFTLMASVCLCGRAGQLAAVPIFIVTHWSISFEAGVAMWWCSNFYFLSFPSFPEQFCCSNLYNYTIYSKPRLCWYITSLQVHVIQMMPCYSLTQSYFNNIKLWQWLI